MVQAPYGKRARLGCTEGRTTNAGGGGLSVPSVCTVSTSAGSPSLAPAFPLPLSSVGEFGLVMDLVAEGNMSARGRSGLEEVDVGTKGTSESDRAGCLWCVSTLGLRVARRLGMIHPRSSRSVEQKIEWVHGGEGNVREGQEERTHEPFWLRIFMRTRTNKSIRGKRRESILEIEVLEPFPR